MKKILLTLFTCGMIIFSFAQESVYFPGFETINVNTKYQYVTSTLFKTYVKASGTYQIILPNDFPKTGGYIETKEETKQNALRHKASYYILSDMSSIGNLLIVNMDMHNSSSGEIVWSESLKADELEDLDPVIQLLANALGSDEPAVEAGNIYSVTQYDSNELKKREATNTTGVYVGGQVLLVSDIKDNMLSGFGITKTYDTRNFILDIKAEFYFSETSNSSRLGMNILKPLTDENKTLLIGGGLFYGGTSIQKNIDVDYDQFILIEEKEFSNSGLEIEGNFGILINRLSNVQLRAMISPCVALYDLDGKTISSIRLGITANF